MAIQRFQRDRRFIEPGLVGKSAENIGIIIAFTVRLGFGVNAHPLVVQCEKFVAELTQNDGAVGLFLLADVFAVHEVAVEPMGKAADVPHVFCVHRNKMDGAKVDAHGLGVHGLLQLTVTGLTGQ